ncbi:hypothetical protein L9F63_005769, partial [Diploptera punctata]
ICLILKLYHPLFLKFISICMHFTCFSKLNIQAAVKLSVAILQQLQACLKFRSIFSFFHSFFLHIFCITIWQFYNIYVYK